MRYLKRIACFMLALSLIICSEGMVSTAEAVSSVSDTNKPATKKGIQIAPAEIDKAIELGCSTVFVNFNFSDFTYETTSDNQGENTYTYGGKTYAVNIGVLQSFNTHFETGKMHGIDTIYCAVVAGSMPGLTDTTPSTALLHAFNTWSSDCKANVTKMFKLLAKYMGANVDYWVMGNEVDHPKSWYEAGKMSEADFIKNYETTLRIMNDAAKTYNKNSRVMISLDYLWSFNWPDGGYNAKNIIDGVAKLTASNNYDWGVAIHPYPLHLKNPNFADDHLEENGYWVTNNINTRAITMNNLDVFTNYMQSASLLYNGKVRPIAITEIGFTAYSSTASGLVQDQNAQAAYYAYAYYKAEANPLIDSFQMRCYKDDATETAQGYYFGLHDLAGNPRKLLEVMKAINTVDGNSVTDKYLSVLGKKSWAELISGYYNIPFVSGASYTGLYYQSSDARYYYLTKGDVDKNFSGIVASKGYIAYLENGAGPENEDVYSVTMKEGTGGIALQTKILDNTSVDYYFVDDESIATVSKDGKITPHKTGTTYLDIISEGSGNTGLMTVKINVWNPFPDVSYDSWYRDSVDYVYSSGYMTGTEEGTFNPKGEFTRAMTAVVLWRMAGSPEPEGTGYFPDVPENRYYTKAIAWAYENGIITGRKDGTFAPKDSIKRQDFALMLYRYADYEGRYTYVWDTESYKACSDYFKTSPYAMEAIQWCYNNDIMGVNSDLKPQLTITRAEAATMLKRFVYYY